MHSLILLFLQYVHWRNDLQKAYGCKNNVKLHNSRENVQTEVLSASIEECVITAWPFGGFALINIQWIFGHIHLKVQNRACFYVKKFI